MNYYNDILIQLRLKSKLGRFASEVDEVGEGFDDPEYVKSLNELLDAFGTSVVDVDGNIKTINNTMENLNKGFVDLSMGMGKVLAIQEKWDSGIESLVKNITWLEEHNKELNKTFGLSSEESETYADKIRELGKEIGYSDETLFKFNKGLNDLTGGMLQSSKMTDAAKQNLYAYQAYAQENLGVTQEAAEGFESYARTMGISGMQAAKTIKVLTDSLAATKENGGLDVGISSLSMQKTIMEEIGALSADVRLNYSKMGGGLEVAVLKAKALGFTMEQLDKAGESLLNIEQSVGSELEYQLLSGRRLTVEGNKSFTNEYRKAKLMGDSTKQTELMADILAKEGKTLKNNFLARQKFAEMTGMGAEELSKALEKQAIAQELGVDQLMKLSGDKLTAKIADLRAQYSKDKTNGDKKIDQLNKFLAANDTRTTHEKVVEDNLVSIAQSIGKIKGNTNIVAEVKQMLPKAIKDSYDTPKTDLATDKVAKAAGKVFKKSEVYKVTKDAQELTRKGLTNTVAGSKAEKINKKLQKLSNAKYQMESASGKKKVTDTVIYPDGAAPVVLDKKDTVYAMRPGDRFDKQLDKSHRDAFAAGERVAQQSLAGNRISATGKPADNSMSMIAAALQRLASSNNNSTPALDVNALASAIATAMQSVKVEAKIRTDDMYSANRMNNKKNII